MFNSGSNDSWGHAGSLETVGASPFVATRQGSRATPRKIRSRATVELDPSPTLPAHWGEAETAAASAANLGGGSASSSTSQFKQTKSFWDARTAGMEARMHERGAIADSAADEEESGESESVTAFEGEGAATPLPTARSPTYDAQDGGPKEEDEEEGNEEERLAGASLATLTPARDDVVAAEPQRSPPAEQPSVGAAGAQMDSTAAVPHTPVGAPPPAPPPLCLSDVGAGVGAVLPLSTNSSPRPLPVRTVAAPPSLHASPSPAAAAVSPTSGAAGLRPPPGRYAPCFGHGYLSLLVPRGAEVSVINTALSDAITCSGGKQLLGAVARSVRAEDVGLSTMMQAAAYDPALRVLLLGDANGYSSRLVAVDAETAAVRWSIPTGLKNSISGIACLPQQSLVVTSSLKALHVWRTGTGEHVTTIAVEGKFVEPTFLCADAATASIYASVRTKTGSGGGGKGVVAAFRWDAVKEQLVPRGIVENAGAVGDGHRPLAVVPASPHCRNAYLVVGAYGTAALRVLTLPSNGAPQLYAKTGCTLLIQESAQASPTANHRKTVTGSASSIVSSRPIRIAGLSASPTHLAVIDETATHYLVQLGSSELSGWTLPPTLSTGSERGYLCMGGCSKDALNDEPAGVCSSCAAGRHALLMGWLCSKCLAAHIDAHAKHEEAMHHVHTGAAAPPPQPPQSIVGRFSQRSSLQQQQQEPFDAVHAAAATAICGSLTAPFVIHQHAAQRPLSNVPYACIAPSGPSHFATLFVPRVSEVAVIDHRGRSLPSVTKAALGLEEGESITCCAYAAGSHSLLVLGSPRIIAVDAATRAVKWASAVPGAVCVVSLPGGPEASGLVCVAASGPSRLCVLSAADGVSDPRGVAASSDAPSGSSSAGDTAGSTSSASSSATSSSSVSSINELLLPEGVTPWAAAVNARDGTLFLDYSQDGAHGIAAFKWVAQAPQAPAAEGPGRPAIARLVFDGLVAAPAEGRAAILPLTVVPPAPRFHDSHLVVAGRVRGGTEQVLHVIALPSRRLIHTHALALPASRDSASGGAPPSVVSLAGDPSGKSLAMLLVSVGGGTRREVDAPSPTDGTAHSFAAHPPPSGTQPHMQSDGSSAVVAWPPPGLYRTDSCSNVDEEDEAQRAAESASSTCTAHEAAGYKGGWGTPPFSLAAHADEPGPGPAEGCAPACAVM